HLSEDVVDPCSCWYLPSETNLARGDGDVGLLGRGVCYRTDETSPSECHHSYGKARRDEVNPDDQTQRPGGSAWPCLDDQCGEYQISDTTCQHPSPRVGEYFAIAERCHDLKDAFDNEEGNQHQ